MTKFTWLQISTWRKLKKNAQNMVSGYPKTQYDIKKIPTYKQEVKKKREKDFEQKMFKYWLVLENVQSSPNYTSHYFKLTCSVDMSRLQRVTAYHILFLLSMDGRATSGKAHTSKQHH